MALKMWDSEIENKIKVFELYSGIGGMHYALEESAVPNSQVVKAIDINPTANDVYKFNFPETCLLERNIQCLTEEDFSGINFIMMSPPCQPFTRIGLQKDMADARTDSLFHIISLLPALKSVNYIILENVKGFEDSITRKKLIEVLKENNFLYQEFLLTPIQFNIPNSRSRYYLIAKRNSLFCFEPSEVILQNVPVIDGCFNCDNPEIKHFIEHQANDMSEYLLPDKVLMKYSSLLDIVTYDSTKSCCFTKSYTRFIEGTGSVFCPKTKAALSSACETLNTLNRNSSEYLSVMKSLKLRFFTPKEVCKLMCFPDKFMFPDDVTCKQRYRLLGNSINVRVVAYLTFLLFKKSVT